MSIHTEETNGGKMKLFALLAALMLSVPVNSQSVYGRPILITWDRSSNDTLEFPKGVYFTYRTTLDPLTGNCNQFSKIGGSGTATSFTDMQAIPGMTYCYKEAFYNGTQSPQSEFPQIVVAQ